jgi:hypothetical protein
MAANDGRWKDAIRDETPLDEANQIASFLLHAAREGDTEAQRKVFTIHLARQNKKLPPLPAIEHYIDYALALRATGSYEWNVCFAPNVTKHRDIITPPKVRKETSKWFDEMEIVEAVEQACRDGFSNSNPEIATETAFHVAVQTVKELGHKGSHTVSPEALRKRYERAKRRK